MHSFVQLCRFGHKPEASRFSDGSSNTTIYLGRRGVRTSDDHRTRLLVLSLHHVRRATPSSDRRPICHTLDFTYYPRTSSTKPWHDFGPVHQASLGPLFFYTRPRGSMRELRLSFSRCRRREWDMPLLERIRILSGHGRTPDDA